MSKNSWKAPTILLWTPDFTRVSVNAQVAFIWWNMVSTIGGGAHRPLSSYMTAWWGVNSSRNYLIISWPVLLLQTPIEPPGGPEIIRKSRYGWIIKQLLASSVVAFTEGIKTEFAPDDETVTFTFPDKLQVSNRLLVAVMKYHISSSIIVMVQNLA